jgi:DNA sulfur modification protein DndD
VFSGKHEIDLSPKIYKEKIRPIIIFGGMNGSGKTTIFDAIKLCLYGSESLQRQSETKYKEYLKEKINSSNRTLIKPDFSSVEIEFEYSSHGEHNIYSIQRYWEKNGKGINETLSIRRNGNLINEVDKEYWQEFVKELIPLGLSELFFFDGEKIQKIMNDTDNAELKKSIMTLLGLDLIERLQSDLKIYKKNLLKQDADPALKEEILRLENVLKEKETQIQKVTYTIESVLAAKINNIEISIVELESKINAQGGSYLHKRQTILESKISTEKELEVIAEKIRELSASLFPVSIAHNLALRLKEQLEKEEAMHIERASGKAIDLKVKAFTKQLEEFQFYSKLKGITINNKDEFAKSLARNIRSAFHVTQERADTPEIHCLSYKQSGVIIDNIDEAINRLPLKLRELTIDYETKYREIQKIYSDIEKVPAEDLLKPLYEKLILLNRDLGTQLAEKKQVEEQKRSLINEKAEIERRKISIESKLNASKVNITKIDMADKANKVLSAYYDQLSKQKIRKLETEFTELFQQLNRKDDLISKIEIDQETLDVYIYDKYGSKLNKNNLSSGELEIYAISMVWALARISGQTLPFAIDTPLARLDSKHRDNLIDKFFPHASHQMLIFSTDTEVDEKYFNMLEPYVSKAYKFEYIDHEKRSEIKEGYFWH